MAAYYQNIDLKTNCDLFAKSLMIDRFDTIKISETWLNDSVHNGELFDSDYLVFTRDKSTTDSHTLESGGSCIAINYK